jgi:antitoxin MazE
METRVKKWGDSLALRIPRTLASEAGLEKDCPVRLSLVEGKLVIEPLVKSEFRLDALTASASTENLHEEVGTGPAVGGEVW